MKNLGEILKELRIERGLTLTDIEKITGINNGSLSRWERNEVLPSITACIQLAKFFDISLDELTGLSDDFGVRTAAPMDEGLSSEEREIIKKYRELNTPGKKLVKTVIDTHLSTMATSNKNKIS